MTRNTTANLTIRIPSTELRGTEAEKLLQLDAILSRLRAIRRDLAPVDEAVVASPESSSRGWWLAGASVVVLLTLFTLWSWAAAGSL